MMIWLLHREIYTAPSYATVKKWAAHFKMGKENLKDDDRYRRPTTATTEENIAHIHRVTLDYRHEIVNQIASTVGISGERVENILHYELGMLKVYARWVPKAGQAVTSKPGCFLKQTSQFS